MGRPISRRRVLAGGGALAFVGAGGGFRYALGQAKDQPAGSNERVRLAVIGCGRRGMTLLRLAGGLKNVSIAMVCDVDRNRAELAAAETARLFNTRPAHTQDFLDVMASKEVDAVIIATPDHWHALMVFYAAVAKKDMYLETPICHQPAESSLIVHVVRKYYRVCQVGLQHRSASWITQAIEAIHNGALGTIPATTAWTHIWAPPIPVTEATEPPESIDYERWVGPAEKMKYNPARVEQYFWRWWAYGGGAITRYNVHMQDLLHWAMKSNVPLSVSAVGNNTALKDFRETPDTMDVAFEYKTRMLPTNSSFVHSYTLRSSSSQANAYAPNRPVNLILPSGQTMSRGIEFTGNKGSIYLDHQRKVESSSDGEQAVQADISNARPGTTDDLTRAHIANFVHCCKTREEPRASVDAGHNATIACQLANISYRLGRRIYFKPDAGCFTDPEFSNTDTQANELLQKPYREAYPPPAF